MTIELTDLWRQALDLFPEANFLQSPTWGKANELIGHKIILEYNLGDEDDVTSPQYWCQMIVKNAKRGRYLEIPGGPLLDWANAEAKELVFAKIKQIAQREKCVFVRLRPQLLSSEADKLQGLNLRKAPMHLHAEHTIIIDLAKSEDQLMSDMRRQTRYEVRRSAKLGIKVRWSNSEEIFKEFHRIQTQTAERQHFIPPSLDMLMAERQAFCQNNQDGQKSDQNNDDAHTDRAGIDGASIDNARIYIAETPEGEPIAYGLILIDGREADYFEAASTDLNHKLPGAYALQWQVIQDLKQLGMKRYNLWGIAPPNQPEHRYAKVTTFKKGFGGEVVEFVPAQDLIIDKLRYQFNLAVETLRKKARHL